MNILELRKQINDINNKYDSKISELKLKIAEIENERNEKLEKLTGQYDAECSNIIQQFENGTYNKMSGVSIRTTKSVSIIDESLIPEMYKKVVVDDKKIKNDLKESGYTKDIPGVKVLDNHSVVVTIK